MDKSNFISFNVSVSQTLFVLLTFHIVYWAEISAKFPNQYRNTIILLEKNIIYSHVTKILLKGINSYFLSILSKINIHSLNFGQHLKKVMKKEFVL